MCTTCIQLGLCFIGSANRRSSDFRREDKVLSKFAADNADFQRSGWSRGHMAPAGDFKYSQVSFSYEIVSLNAMNAITPIVRQVSHCTTKT